MNEVSVQPMLAINTPEFIIYYRSFGTNEPIPVLCPKCGGIFHRDRNYFSSKFGKGNSRSASYCSRQCLYDISQKWQMVKCKTCDLEVRKTPSELRGRNPFCGSKCAAIYTNKHCITANSKSIRAEKISAAAKLKKESRPKSTRVSYGSCSWCKRQFVYKHSKKRRSCCGGACRKALLSAQAKRNGLGGNFSNRAWGWYDSPSAGRVWLESSYEYRVASDLDANRIDWCRPASFPYIINGIERKYYPDFYIKSLNVYLDPKNDYLIQKDSEKIAVVEEQNAIRVLVLRECELSFRHVLDKLGAGSGT